MHCADGRGRHTNPTINLSRCLGNTGGRLVGGHDFHKTCRDFVVTGSVLHANCDDGSGFEKWPATFFDLDTILCNRGGKLRCSIQHMYDQDDRR
ncbi:hypothetical protein ACCO45_004610 [Purpureocillium lilacinum]|uniref:Uncharacterized protein n=1 Tax=Purpureocillium lilacinum TaxID=33203 RepID=A0ACC4DTZ8_PURLI